MTSLAKMDEQWRSQVIAEAIAQARADCDMAMDMGRARMLAKSRLLVVEMLVAFAAEGEVSLDELKQRWGIHGRIGSDRGPEA